MITGEDMSRLPEVTHPSQKKAEEIEASEEKPSYAQVFRLLYRILNPGYLVKIYVTLNID